MDQAKLSGGCILILRRLYNQKRIGGRHIPLTIVHKWIKHLSKEEHRMAVSDWNLCVKEGLILLKPKPNDLHVSLNPRRIDEVRSIMEGSFGEGI